MDHSPFFFATEIVGENILIEGADARHLSVVRRAKVGDGVTVCDGRGSVHRCEIVSIKDVVVEVRRVSSTYVERPSPRLTVFQALPKGSKPDSIVQKLVEVGVERIVLFKAERAAVRWDERSAARNIERLQLIALQAAKQSRRTWLPEVELGPPTFQGSDGHLCLVAHEGSDIPLRQALPKDEPPTISLIVGPEGGFTDSEVDRFVASGAKQVLLGPHILRTETAAIVCASLVLFFYGALG
ncbi:MAG: RsmE family RNA methyltransferase [Actinomycetota bacterium]